MSPRGTVVNGLLQTGALGGAPWSQSNLPTITGGQLDPFGGTGASLLVESTDGAATAHETEQVPGAAFNGQVCIASAYFKLGTRLFFAIAPNSGGNGAVFDPSTFAAVGSNGSIAGQGIGVGVEPCRENPAWGYRAWVKFRHTVGGGLRFYPCGNGAPPLTYQGNGSGALTLYGPMIEIAQPGQDTPSPYVASGATAGVGRRECRQNLILWSEDFTKAAWTNVSTTVTPGQVDPLGGVSATKLAMTAAGVIYQTFAVGTPGLVVGGTYTEQVWLWTDGGGKATIGLRMAGSGGTLVQQAVTLTNVPKLYSITAPLTGTGSTIFSIENRAGLGGDGIAGYCYAWRPAAAQTNGPFDYIRTTSAPANANGAPRSVVI